MFQVLDYVLEAQRLKQVIETTSKELPATVGNIQELAITT